MLTVFLTLLCIVPDVMEDNPKGEVATWERC